MPRLRPLALILPLLVALVALPAQGRSTQPATRPATQPATIPAGEPEQVTTLLSNVAEAYAQLNGLRLEATVTAEYDVAGRAERHETAYSAALGSQGRFRHEVPGELVISANDEATIVYFPGSLRYYRHERDKAGTAERGDDIGPAAREALLDHNPSLLLALEDDAGTALRLWGALTPGDDESSLGVGRPDGTRWVLRFDPQTHLLRSVEVDERVLFEEAGVPQVAAARRTINYTTIDTGAAVPEEALAFALPDTAQEVEVAQLPGAGSLEGAPAPELSLPDLAGKVVSLQGLAGKVVLVDFWASWCGPCIHSMPHVKSLAEELGGEGLVVLAVNLQENDATIQGFVTEHGLEGEAIRVLRDRDGSTARRWGVTGIPFTAVIGRDGVVQKVVVGLSPEEVAEAVRAALAEEMPGSR